MPPKLQILSTEGAKWLGYCEHRLVALSLHREFLNRERPPESRVRIIRQNYELPNGVKATVISADICDIIRIRGGAAGFIFHPRSDSFPGGISSTDGKPISAVYAYPLVDDDHGSGVLSGDAESWEYASDPENYGNLDWKGNDEAIVSWRGPSGRSLPMDSFHDYPGFTVFDYETTEDIPVSHYTPYQNLVYQGGEILFEFPVTAKVLGATDTYVVLGIDYAGRTNPDAGMNGFYTEVWQGVDKRIGWLHDSRPTVPWFFNQAGNEAVSAGKKLVIAEDGESVAFSTLALGTGSETKSITQAVSWGLERTGNFQAYHDYVGDVLANINLLIMGEDSSILTGSDSESFSDFPVMISGVQATSLLITGPDAYGGVGAYTATLQPPGAGDCGDDIVWSYPSVSCGMGTVSATKSGVSGSKQVRMATGGWYLSLTEYWMDNYLGLPDHSEATAVLNNLRITELWQDPGYVVNQAPHLAYNILTDECVADIMKPDSVSAKACSNALVGLEAYSFVDDDGCYSYSLIGNGVPCVYVRQTYVWACSSEGITPEVIYH